MSSSGGGGVGGAAAAFVRQRYNASGYSSSGGEDLEDDASGPSVDYRPQSSRLNGWCQRLETLVWLASAVFIIYCGDLRSNFFTLLLRDERIKSIESWVIMCSLQHWDILISILLGEGYGQSRWQMGHIGSCCHSHSNCNWPPSIFSILLGIVANMEFFDIASIVHIVYGFCGYISIYSDICKNETRCILTPLRLMETLKSMERKISLRIILADEHLKGMIRSIMSDGWPKD